MTLLIKGAQYVIPHYQYVRYHGLLICANLLMRVPQILIGLTNL